MKNFNKQYADIFDYLSADEAASHETGTVVFGRKDLLVARKTLDIIQRGDAKWTIITGGVGKDSGDLQIPEAVYLANEINEQSQKAELTLPPLYLDITATNGGENARNSLAIISHNELDDSSGVTAVAHATSSRRLGEMLKHAAHQQENPLTVYREATNYNFDPTNPSDQAEARGEILRLADWPEKDWLLPQSNLPENMIDFVRDIESKKNQ
jgi:hypothetical protein